MAFNYFSKQLLNTDKIDLAAVFPEKQQVAKNNQRVSYGLEDIILYIKEATEDFKFYDQKYAELDAGVKELINKYFISIGKDNPFEQFGPKQGLTPEYKEGVVPKESVVVEKDKDGLYKVTGKGVKAPPKEVAKVATEIAIQKVADEDAATALLNKVDKYKKELANRQDLLDDFVSIGEVSEKEDLMKKYQNQLMGLKDLIEDEVADDFDKEKYKLLSDFIQKNS